MAEKSNNSDVMYNVSLISDENEQIVSLGNEEFQFDPFNNIPVQGLFFTKVKYLCVVVFCDTFLFDVGKKLLCQKVNMIRPACTKIQSTSDIRDLPGPA